MTAEAPLLSAFATRASILGSRLFRNHVGHHLLANGRRITSGLAPGSADLIGLTPVVITPDMVGKTVAMFLSVEAKRPGWKEPKTPNKTRRGQIAWQAMINSLGGNAGTASSIEELEAIIARRP